MALISKREVFQLVRPHYLINILLAISFLFVKKNQFLNELLFNGDLDFTNRESEILFFTAAIIVFRTRRQNAVSLLPYISTACMFAKLGNVLLFSYSDPIYGVIFAVFCLLHLLLLRQPSYQGPEQVTYFRSIDLENQLKSSDGVWLIELYTAWSPSCVEFSNVYAELSSNFHLDNLRFGKVDLSRNPETADKYKINTTPLSKQLPTLILFQDGKEVMRRPIVQKNGRLASFAFTYENIVTTYNLKDLYKECKEKLSKRKTPIKPKVE